MSKIDIIESVENNLKRAMVTEAKFQAKHAPTGKVFVPNYKPVHNAVKPVRAVTEIVIPNEDIIVEMLVVYFRHDYFPENFWRIAWELSAKTSNVVLAYYRHQTYIMGR